MSWAGKEKQNNRRIGGALVCAALLHIALFAAIEVFSNFSDAPHQSNRSTVARIQLTQAQAKQKPASRATEKSGSESSKHGQIQNRTQSANPERKTPEAPPSETLEKAPADKHQKAKFGPSEVVESVALDEGSVSPPHPQSSQSAGELKTGQSAHASEILFSPQAAQTQTQAAAQSSTQTPVHKKSSSRAEIEQQEFTVYLQQLIEEKRRYPLAARRRNIEGSVEFSVHVNREGSLGKLSLNSSSGSRILDEAAEDLLERVFPVDYPLHKNVRTTIRIIYKLTEV